jgi:hypothetical protein
MMRKEVWVLWSEISQTPTNLKSSNFTVVILCLNGHPALPCGHVDLWLWDSKHSWNVGKLLPDYKALQPWRQSPTHSQPRETDITQNDFCTVNWSKDISNDLIVPKFTTSAQLLNVKYVKQHGC